MRCDHCPRAPGLACAGEDVPRLCTLVDPSSPDRRPEYLEALAFDLGPAPEPPPPPLPLAVAIQTARLGLLNCPDAEPPSCSCEGAVHCRRRAALATLRDCAACLGLTKPDAEP